MKDRERVRQLQREMTNEYWREALAIKDRNPIAMWSAERFRKKASDKLSLLVVSGH